MQAVDCIAAELKRRNLRLWTFPGGTVYPLYHACHQAGVEIIVCRSEAGAGYAAIGAAKATGQSQVVAVTSGPGATNVVTAIADAYYDSVPVVFLTGQVGTKDLGYEVRQRGFQQTPVVEMTQPITKSSTYGQSPTDLVHQFYRALSIAISGRRGPCLVDMPMDSQRGEANYEYPFGVSNVSSVNLQPLPEQLRLLESLLAQSSRPVFLIGMGCTLAYSQLRQLVEKLGIPTVSSLPAVGLLPTASKCNFGYVGHTGHPWANWIVQHSNLVLCLGARLDVRQTGTEVDGFAPEAKIVRVDIDKSELENSRVRCDLSINARCKEVIEWLLKNLGEDWRDDWFEECVEEKYTTSVKYGNIQDGETAKIIREISANAPEDCIFVNGVGSHQQHAARHLSLDTPWRVLLTSAGHGCMGAGLPMAIGAALATGRRTVLIDGDGSFQMSMNELGTVADNNLDIDIHIVNNRSGGIVSQFARLQGWEPVETTWLTLDFEKIAEVYALSLTVHRTDDEGVWPILESGHQMDDMRWQI